MTNGILINTIYVETMIIEEFLFVYELYQDNYEKSTTWINTHNDFSFPTIGSINFPLNVGPKQLNVSFYILPSSDQFHVKLGYPWLQSMNFIPLVVHKCLNFPFGNEVITINGSGFSPMSSRGKFSLDLFCP